MNSPERPLSLLQAWLLVIATGALAASAAAQEPVVPRERHPWASFRAGSWKLVQVTTETFDVAGAVAGTSVTETRTMLARVDAEGYELQIDVTVDVAGKRFSSEPRFSRHGFHGEAAGQKPAIRRLGDREWKIDGRRLLAHTAEVEIADEESRKVVWLHYSPASTPFVLARRSMTFDAAGKLQQETEVETRAVDVRRTILGFRLSTWETQTTHKPAAGGRIVTDEIHSAQIPGGVVEHASEEYDDKDRLLRRSKLELLSFGIARGDPPPRRRRGK